MNHKRYPFKVGKGGVRPHETVGTMGTGHPCRLCTPAAVHWFLPVTPEPGSPDFTGEEAEAWTVYKLPQLQLAPQGSGTGLGGLLHAVTSGDRSLHGDLEQRSPWVALTCSKAFLEQSLLGSHVDKQPKRGRGIC